MKPQHTKYHILIVDDVSENIQILSNILYQQGMNILIAQSGRETLNIISRKTPDLILLDILMPDMSGYDVCKQIKSTPETKEIPIIFLTAKTQPEDIIKGFEAGAVDYVTKPFNPTELLARVFTQLELKKFHDIITEQNRQLAEQNIRLHQLNATKDKFFSIIAHDLKNPFNTLMILSEILKDELSNSGLDDSEKYARMIYQTTEQSYRLLKNLLEWANSQTGKIQFTPKHVNLKKIIKTSIRALEIQANNKQIALNTDIPEDISAFADVRMISTILRNLVSNALKFTKSGGTISVRARDRGERIEISVSDTGIGINKEDVKKLFRLDTHHSTLGTAKEKGSGLGLILCKEFVEKHKGELWVKSEVGEGSRFTFTIPLAPKVVNTRQSKTSEV